jgi:GNAT superfamily N-acetyltransferase
MIGRFKTYRPCDIDKKYDKQLYNCSLRYYGHMWYSFKKNRQCDKSKVVICFIKDKIIGWGFRFKYAGKVKYSVMLYVRKPHRNLGIGTQIYRTLTRGIRRVKIKVYPDYVNKKFFEKINS